MRVDRAFFSAEDRRKSDLCERVELGFYSMVEGSGRALPSFYFTSITPRATEHVGIVIQGWRKRSVACGGACDIHTAAQLNTRRGYLAFAIRWLLRRTFLR